MAINKASFMKELKTWTKPAKGFSLTLGKAAYHIAKGVVRHPYLSIAGGLMLKAARKPGKFAKGLKFGQGPYAGKPWTKKGKWLL